VKKGLNLLGTLLFGMKKLKKWMKTTGSEFAGRFSDPVLQEAFKEMWIPDFSILFMMFAYAYLHNKNAGYPIGGSLPMSEALEKRYIGLGGKIHYNNKVEKILASDGSATGIRLEDQTEYLASVVISAADGYSTIYKMLDGKFTDEQTREPYEKWPTFSSLLFIGLGVNRDFKDFPVTVSGMSYPLPQPIEIGKTVLTRLPVHIFNQDHTLAPSGKTSVIISFESDYTFWKELSAERESYLAEKEKAARLVIGQLEQRFPGISADIEMIDVATPLTFERYTGNWKGSFEGWLITPDNAHTLMKPMKQTLPGLRNFYMCGQWVEPGGGLPTGVMSARRLMKALCKADGKKFRTTVN
jgi:phytoene dehydrogenase-like protein